MFDHVELPVTDLAVSATFYRAALTPLGIEQNHLSDAAAEFGALSLVPRPPRERVHFAFIAESREAV